MKKYQPFIINLSDEILKITEEQGLIPITPFARDLLCDMLTEKFIKGEISSTDTIDGIFEENEFMEFLHKVIIRDQLDLLKEMELINSYDEDGDEMYFLTNKGKDYLENLLET